MPKIYDNIENKLKEGLNKTLEKAKRADFCIGYFNLSGWKQIYQQGENLPSTTASQKKNSTSSSTTTSNTVWAISWIRI